MRRPQFSLKTLLWLTTVLAAFLGGLLAGVKLESLRYDFELGPGVYLHDDGTPAAPGVRTNQLRHRMSPKYPWLDYLPGAPSRSMSSSAIKPR